MLISILVGLVAGLVGTWLGIKYVALASDRQEKSLLVLLVKEFSVLLKRATNHYEEFLKEEGSYLNMFESFDPSVFTNLAELTKNTGVIEAALELKADFGEVARYANKASDAMVKRELAQKSGDYNLAEQKFKEARGAQELTMLFFVGEIEDKEGFARYRYHAFIANLLALLDHLDNLASASRPMGFVMQFVPELRSETLSLRRFVGQSKAELKLLKEKLDLLREMEKLLHAKED
jgi:hypothetical protein